MENISLPTKIEIQENKEDKNKAKIILEPCYPGYGVTLGNALRRVLLSSLSGAAVTAVKIKGIAHEFSAIPYVKEDAIEIVLNLKLLRIKIFTPGLYRLTLNIEGEKKVKAKDIKAPSQVEIINSDLNIFNTTNKNAKIEMEIWVESGLGYVPVEDKGKDKFELGVIVIDSIFTPIRKVGMEIENVRVGEKINYDKLVLDIETDGTITPKEALQKSTQILIDHFNFILEEQKQEKVVMLKDKEILEEKNIIKKEKTKEVKKIVDKKEEKNKSKKQEIKTTKEKEQKIKKIIIKKEKSKKTK
ncbi:DNA-directed RNA polymerase subunit alpha [Candidatus Kuenenbacteria bacterium HGW-Kuenenbacteria-1]|uniref:DNA-directed RNA polymerase subunit alpha n=1 Tax=Candidatus Kuenenbacteria bacterium HGW-Kuenenbacteria-1 TaxID=2013812 RepID=A0A2N1UMS0_9BACT|nr:MAG: DNA-directed RNA polymerase subunit alpha [Candidatus Kuenenbacteria bacterium HGW-Kuenenbacteria-1]